MRCFPIINIALHFDKDLLDYVYFFTLHLLPKRFEVTNIRYKIIQMLFEFTEPVISFLFFLLMKEYMNKKH